MRRALLLLNSFAGEGTKTLGSNSFPKVPQLINEARCTQQSDSKDHPHHCPQLLLGGSGLPPLNLHDPVWLFLFHVISLCPA